MAIFTRRSLRLGPAVVPTEPVEVDRSTPLADGLIGGWLLNNFGSLDLSELGHTATLHGNLKIGVTPIGPALRMDGNNANYLDFGQIPEINAIGGNPEYFSFSLWILPTGTSSYSRVFGNCSTTSSNTEGFGLRYNGTTLEARLGGNGVSFGNSPLNQLTHVAFTSSKPGASYYATNAGYVNGKQVYFSNNGYAAPGPNNPYNFLIGKDWGDAAFTGFISTLLIYSRALLPSEVFSLYAEPFAMLRPDVRRQYYVAASAVAPGTTRQPVIWFGN